MLDYQAIKPRVEYFLDEVILSHSRKKVDNYIRRHNWFGDHLELDLHIINSEENIKKWITDVESKSFKTDKIYIVPAPKNFEWTFKNNEVGVNEWVPNETDDNKFKLRPISHVSLRDQTLSMSMLICLANIIETLQGRTDVDYIEARKNNVVSYGNRLYCDWLNDSTGNYYANFMWGNSQIYRKYYDDYKLFLERPKSVCTSLLEQGEDAENLYIISFDLEKFYDNINPSLLVKKLKNIFEKEEEEIQPEFIDKLEGILAWDYVENKESELFTVENEKFKIGLPQGLAASGFFANIYMIDFDREVEKFLKNRDILVEDYIRYVDDMRFIVNLSKNNKEIEALCEELGEGINKLLKQLNPYESTYELKVNSSKSDFVSYKNISVKSSLANKMNLLQSNLSGTPDLETLESTIIGLDNLLDISNLNKNKNIDSIFGISKLKEENLEVRDDTIKRFAALRIYNGLRLKESLVDIDKYDSGNDQNYIKSVNNEVEIYAKKFISYWVYNPSLFLLLKFGLDLYPNASIARNIVEVLNSKLKNNYTSIQDEQKRQYKVAEFIATDLLINTAKFIAFERQVDEKNILEFREVILNFAEEVVNNKDSSWYIIQAATLCLITFGRNHFSLTSRSEILQKQKILLGCTKYEVNNNENIDTLYALGIIVQQISPNRNRYVNWLVKLILDSDENKLRKIIELIIQDDKTLISDILNTNVIKDEKVIKILTKCNISGKHLKLKNKVPFNLSDIIVQKDNVFMQENAILLLLNRILTDSKIMKKLQNGEVGINNLTISCEDWNAINNPFKVDKKFIILGINKNEDSNIDFPKWVREEEKWSYGLGMIIRSCITGNIDYTGSYNAEIRSNRYRGIKNTLYTRSLGINNFRHNLNNIKYPITPDMLNILFATLRYPGLTLNNKAIEIISDSNNFLKEIIRMIRNAQGVYGNLTRIPGYVYTVKNFRNYSKRTLRILSVQTLMPGIDDIKYSNPNVNSKEYKSKHRNHLAGICNLISKYLKVHCLKDKSEPYVDLIVFPELAVRYEDVDLLKNLSDNTKATIFTGLTYIAAPNEELINQALWLIREETPSGRSFVEIFQGKQYPTRNESDMDVIGYKPYQVFIEFELEHVKAKVTGAICYDATNLALAADLRDSSDIFVVAAYNKDINTFDNMVASLNYHMYQPVILVNCGEYGGSTTQAPYAEHHKMISNTHGGKQIGISICEVDPSQFMDVRKKKLRLKVKTAPAGFKGRLNFKI